MIKMGEKIYQIYEELKKEFERTKSSETFDLLRTLGPGIIKTYDSDLIVDYFHTIEEPEMILEHFGKDSIEYIKSVLKGKN